MRLSELTKGYALKPGAGDPEITLVTEDSRRVRPGALFVAIAGTTRDGHAFVREALDRGAAAVVVERPEAAPPGAAAHAIAPSTRRALAVLASRFHGNPATGLSVIGFTGTFGKTTTSDILRALFEAAGRRPAVIGSLGARFEDFYDRGDGLTTPAPPQLQEWLSAVRERGARTVIVEVTSHALRLERVHGLKFDGGLIAAVMPGEHTDFHRTYDDYVAAKRLFLDHLRPEATLAFDADNRAARTLGLEAPVATRAGMTFSGRGEASVFLESAVFDDRGVSLTVRSTFFDGRADVRSALLGRRNARNAGLALAYAVAAGIPMETAREVLERLQPLRRRMERFDVSGRTVLDDTAGHPDSLHAVFEVVGMLRRERLIVVWAIRGGRGPHINTAIASALADLASEHGAEELIVTAAADEVEPKDRVRAGEVDAARAALDARGRRYVFEETLERAMARTAACSRAGDLVVLAGAQGMNEGRRLLHQVLLDEQRPR
ncbi:MAG: hypothetical protein HYU53_05110 [Acidobacteria bacterium]|nr:hypothetical protein [Acidobacteriota bacterium]